MYAPTASRLADGRTIPLTLRRALAAAALCAAGAAPAALAQGDSSGRPECDERRGGLHHTISSDGDGRGKRAITKLRWTRGGCAVELEAEGEFAIRADLTDIERLSPGGYLEIRERVGRTRHELEITADDSGRLTRRYSVSGERAAWDEGAQRWLASVLMEMERRTAFAAATRVPALVARGGSAAVLDEISRMGSDYSKRRYYTELLRADSAMDAAALGRVYEHAGRGISSDYELAETLIQSAKARRLGAADRAAQGAYVRATASIASDYEHRRALTALLDATGGGVPDERVAAEIFGAARDINSDYEAAELLIGAVRRGLVRGEATEPFFGAVAGIGSAYERRRALSALLAADSVGDDVVASVLKSSAGISSDYERAELLVSVARKRGGLTGELREAYLDAADRIRSDHERNRAVAALGRRR